jgi:hypothetical protein
VAHFPQESEVPGRSGVDSQIAELYRELRTIAARHLRGLRSGDTIQPTVLLQLVLGHGAVSNTANTRATGQNHLFPRRTRVCLISHVKGGRR